MKHLKRFTESQFLDKLNTNDLSEAYISLCEILDEVIDARVIVRIQTKNFTFGILKKDALHNFLTFCEGMRETTYYLQFEFNGSEVEEYRKENGRFPEWFVEDLQRCKDFLELEGWNTRLEIMRPNRGLTDSDYSGKEVSGVPGYWQTINCEVSHINQSYKDTFAIFLIFSKLPNPTIQKNTLQRIR
jgi:hypothetical protein